MVGTENYVVAASMTIYTGLAARRIVRCINAKGETAGGPLEKELPISISIPGVKSSTRPWASSLRATNNNKEPRTKV
jgi:hypothetical protein